jgi:hypothetical protein
MVLLRGGKDVVAAVRAVVRDEYVFELAGVSFNDGIWYWGTYV